MSETKRLIKMLDQMEKERGNIIKRGMNWYFKESYSFPIHLMILWILFFVIMC